MKEQADKQLKRPPVVVVMGHVDHGKTTLLDYIRKSNVAAKEAGGITQAVGAYEIEHLSPSSKKSEKITFIDTPGHQAFTKMRSRGAKIADIAILVVAADDGVKPQTEEAINIIQSAKVPFVVAINKIDKNNADVERVKGDLAKHNVLLEGFGGNISFQPISAKTGEGVEELLDLLLLVADVEGLTYSASAPASGFVLEAHRDNRVGNVVSVIIKNGALKVGDLVFAGQSGGKVKGLKNFLNKPVKLLSPSSPAIIMGFDSLPEVGEQFSIGEAQAKTKQKELSTSKAVADSDSINFVLKAGVAGSLEALAETIKQIKAPEGKHLRIIDQSVGEVTEGDAKLASSTNSHIVAFDTKISNAAATIVRNNHLKIFESKIIYHILEKIETFLKLGAKLPVIGQLEVLAVFDQKNLLKQVVGGKVSSGVIKNQSDVEIQRGEEVIGKAKIMNLQHQKKDVQEVFTPAECGLLLNSKTRVQTGDFLLLRAEEI